MSRFKDLKVWQRSKELAVLIYRLTQKGPFIGKLIDVGSFDNQILKDLGPSTDSRDIPREIKFKTSIPKQSNSFRTSAT